jgi:hypothetical protein
MLDADEIIEVVTVSLGEAVAMVERREITDAKTIIGLLLAQNRLIRDPIGPKTDRSRERVE